MRTELNRLKHLVINRGYTARQAVANGYFFRQEYPFSVPTDAALRLEANGYSH